MAKYLVVFCLLVVNILGRVPKTFIESKINWRIIGGSNAPDGEYKYQISLLNDGSHSCGGSIVSNEYVITAAHCVVGHPVSSLSVRAGTNQLSQGGVVYAVTEIHYPEEYDSKLLQNDVAIMRVEPISFTDKVQAILVEKEYVEGDQDVVLSGWGLSHSGSIPDDLQHINLKTLTIEDCKSRGFSRPIIDTHICTFTITGKGACQGDSGGPLVRSVDGTKKLVGIVSWGKRCAIGYPDVFTRVSSYVSWLNKKCNNCLA